MGTLCEVALDAGARRDAAGTALLEVEQRLREFELRWSPWGTGELGQLNHLLETGQPAPVSDALRPLLSRALALREPGAGAFDIRVGALVRLWGFDDDAHARSAPPDGASIAALLDRLRTAPPALTGCCYGPAPGVQLDLGAIAKGAAAAESVEHLARAGFANALVNLGGNVVASGQRGARPWKVGIRHPRASADRPMLATLSTNGTEAVVTSGDYERMFEHAGRRYHHLLDPGTGMPARGLVAVTVVHPDAALADAASTALFVAGPERWRDVARALGIQQALVVHPDLRVRVTAALAQRLEFAGGIVHEVAP